MLDAKNALVEAEGDLEKASELLRQKGMASAEKKSGRITAEGQVGFFSRADHKMAALVEVNCETDFVARGDDFVTLVKTLSEHVATQNPPDVETCLSQSLEGGTVKDYLTSKISQIKENITIRRFTRYETSGQGRIQIYIHTGGKIGVMVALSAQHAATEENAAFQQLAKDVAMQIASAAPVFVSRDDIPEEVIAEETRVELGKEDVQNKPEEIRQKIVEGRVNKLLGQQILLEQPFVKDPGKTIQTLLDEVGKDLNDTLTIQRFTRYVLGEGLEKKQENFAQEVMAQLK